MRIKLSLRDGLRARPGSARHCVIATAAERQWGGKWTVTPKGVEHVSDEGRTMKWRPSAGAVATMFLFDMGLPVPARSVRLIRGKSVPPRRVRRARKAAVGVGAGGVLFLVVSGLTWALFVIAGAVIAVLMAVAAVKVRTSRRSVVPAWPAPAPARPAPSLSLPQRPQPELEPVQSAVPKAAPVIREPAPQLAASRQPQGSDA